MGALTSEEIEAGRVELVKAQGDLGVLYEQFNQAHFAARRAKPHADGQAEYIDGRRRQFETDYRAAARLGAHWAAAVLLRAISEFEQFLKAPIGVRSSIGFRTLNPAPSSAQAPAYDPQPLIAKIIAAGCRVTLGPNETVKVVGPAIDQALMAELKEHKPEVIRALRIETLV